MRKKGRALAKNVFVSLRLVGNRKPKAASRSKALVIADVRAMTCRRAVIVFFDNHGRPACHDRNRGDGWILHRLNDVGVDALLVQTDDLCGGQRSCDSRSTNVVLNQCRVDACPRHRDDFVDIGSSGLNLSAQLRGNLSPVLGSHFVHAGSDCRAGQSAKPAPDKGAGSGVASLVADDGAGSSAGKGPQPSTPVGIIGRPAACEGADNERDKNGQT